MPPKEKAKEIVDKYFELFGVEIENTISNYEAKQCALIAVDEMLNVISGLDDSVWYLATKGYLQQVKKEIEAI